MYYMNITFLLEVFQTGGKNDIERAQRAHARQGGVALWRAPGEMPTDRGPVHMKERTLSKAAVRSRAPAHRLSMGSGAFDFWFGSQLKNGQNISAVL